MTGQQLCKWMHKTQFEKNNIDLWPVDPNFQISRRYIIGPKLIACESGQEQSKVEIFSLINYNLRHGMNQRLRELQI